MCSYNKFGGSWTCENKNLLTTILKGELDFQGYVVSDWNAQHATAGSATAGMDMSMPSDDFGNNVFLWGAALTSTISSGSVPQSRVDDMVTRILASWYLVARIAATPASQVGPPGTAEQVGQTSKEPIRLSPELLLETESCY